MEQFKMTQQERENKIKELENQIAELKAVKVEEPQPKRWKPEFEDLYFCVGVDGSVMDYVWDGGYVDEWEYLTGNCFKTKEEAEEYQKQIEYTARYKNHIEEHSEPLDWENDKQCKYLVEFSYNGHRITINNFYALKKQGAIYASSEQIIWDAINEIGEDNFKKYVLGVK